jgi:diadenosine tetraphosphate (Ap4A) HIT family hydrolase
MNKTLSREEYEIYVKSLAKGHCAFCVIENQIVLGESKYWYWIASLSPYWKHHTMLIPKRHESSMSHLTQDELSDYFSYHKIISTHLINLNLVHDDGEVFNQILTMIRERTGKSNDQSKEHEKTDHLHIHIVPDKEGFERYVLDPLATDFDFERLKIVP